MEKKGGSVMRQAGIIAGFALCCTLTVKAQATKRAEAPLFDKSLQSPLLVADELQHFMLTHVPKLPAAKNADDWKREAEGLRAHELEVLFHGWPREWVDAKPKFEQVGVIERPGYRVVKLRYEIVPGFESTALLYEPEHLTGKMPAILDVNGHGPGGKAVEHLQKRCINQARRGIFALSLEWIFFGELSGPENAHNTIGLLDLAGANGVGLFYLAMRRGLDYLYDDPRVDRTRIGMTGLSGGGWQTMLLSSLDKRVGPAVPVAGFTSLTTAIEHPEYAGDAEQNGADMRSVADYAQLMALRAPRPTLLIYNAMDDCCYRAELVKQGVYSDIQPYFRLMGSPGDLEWYVNEVPGTHNYQIDSRQRAYKFFDSAFGLNVSDKEDADTDMQVLSEEALDAGLPKDNLTILGLAREMAKSIHHQLPARTDTAWVDEERKKLREVVRYSAVTVTHAWPVNATHENNLDSREYRFEFSNGLCATGVLLQSSVRPQNGGLTVLIADGGRAQMMDEAGNDVDRGQRVLVLEPLFFGENIPGTAQDPGLATYGQMMNTVGERPVGLEAAQTAAVVRWLQGDTIDGTSTPGASRAESGSATPVRVVTSGPRAETVAMVTAALAPELFSGVEARHGLASFGDVFEHPPSYEAAPELMCLDLYKEFDFNVLSAIAAPVKIELQGKDAEVIFWD
jgi:dienelactone hydrolase